MYYEWSYDDDPIMILELEAKTLYEYWHVILAGTIIGVIAVILIITLVVIPHKKKPKKEKTAQPQVAITTVPAPQPITAPSQSRFCPNCGSKVGGDTKFCTSCGSSLND